MDYDEYDDPDTIATLERWLLAHADWDAIEVEVTRAEHVRYTVSAYVHNEWLPNYDDHRLDWPVERYEP